MTLNFNKTMTTKEEIREIIKGDDLLDTVMINKIYALHKQKMIEFVEWYQKLTPVDKCKVSLSHGIELHGKPYSELFDLFEQENNK